MSTPTAYNNVKTVIVVQCEKNTLYKCVHVQ